MDIKKFIFPTFKEWNTIGNKYGGGECEKRNYRTSLGDYNLHIRAAGWYNPDDKSGGYTQYQLAISINENPLNVYSNTIINEYHKYYYDNSFNERDLEIWYNNVTVKANEIFRDYIIKKYCDI